MIPLYRADRRLGRAGTARRDGQVRHLHDGGLAADARVGDRLRAVGRARSTSSRRGRATAPGSSSASRSRSRSRRRSSRCHGWLPDAYRESSPEVAAVLSGVISKAAVFGFIRICLVQVPGAVRRLPRARARTRRDRARLRVAAGLPRARRPRRDRLLEPRADGSDHDRIFSRQHLRDQRRSAAVGQPRADLGRRSSCSPGAIERRTSTGELRAARRHGPRPAGAGDDAAWRPGSSRSRCRARPRSPASS